MCVYIHIHIYIHIYTYISIFGVYVYIPDCTWTYVIVPSECTHIATQRLPGPPCVSGQICKQTGYNDVREHSPVRVGLS